MSTSFQPGTARPAIHFSSFRSDAYFYGLAPGAAVSLTIVPEGATAIAADGTFVAAIADGGDQPPATFQWRFLDAAGNVLAQGNGPTE